MELSLCKYFVWFLIPTAIACKSNPKADEKPLENPVESKSDKGWSVVRTNGKFLEFRNGKGMNTRLSKLRFIGEISNGSKAPFFVYTGLDCDTCKLLPMIYMHSPEPAEADARKGVDRYAFPGSVYDPDGTLRMKSRVFFGQVLNDTRGLIIYYEQQTSSDRSKPLVKSTLVVSVNDGYKRNYIINNGRHLDETLALVDKGLCKEIEGDNR